MATTKRGEKRRTDDNERISKRNTDEAEKRMRTDDSVEGIYDIICTIFFYKKLYTV
jgi:hypothetical protein